MRERKKEREPEQYLFWYADDHRATYLQSVYPSNLPNILSLTVCKKKQLVHIAVLHHVKHYFTNEVSF